MELENLGGEKLIKIYGDCSKEVKDAANSKLRDFIDLFYNLINDTKETDLDILHSLFPTIIVNEKPDKCIRAVEDLYHWSNDSFNHTLKPLHEYALFRILQDLEEQFIYENENIYDMKEYIPSDEDEERYEYNIEDTHTFYFYYCNCFLDFDFNYIDEYITLFEEGEVTIFEELGIDIAEYQDLIPSDIIDNNQELYNAINKQVIEPKEEVHLTKEQFFNHLKKVVTQFNFSIVNHSLYKLLWNDDGTPRKEKSAQDLFLNNIYLYCSNNGIDVSKEPNIGRGPVDFKLSHGILKVLIEVKLASNSSFWHGLEVQTIQYMIQENVKHAIFLVIVNYPEEHEKLQEIYTVIDNLNKKYSFNLTVEIVDATKDKLSASKMDKDDLSFI